MSEIKYVQCPFLAINKIRFENKDLFIKDKMIASAYFHSFKPQQGGVFDGYYLVSLYHVIRMAHCVEADERKWAHEREHLVNPEFGFDVMTARRQIKYYYV
jgi:hypothetical protein